MLAYFGTCQAVNYILRRRIEELGKSYFSVMCDFVQPRGSANVIFLISELRSGSTMFATLLSCHPDITTGYEVLNPVQIPGMRFVRGSAATRRYLETLFSAMRGKLVSGNLHLSQMRSAGLRVSDLRAWFPRSKFLICYRKSLIDQFVSLKLAEFTGRWRADHPHEETDESITINPEEFAKYCHNLKSEYTSLMHQLSPCTSDCLLVPYEDVILDPQMYFDDNVFPFLQLEPVQVHTPLRKQNRRSGMESIQNPESVLPLLKGEFAQLELCWNLG